jgi:hypothetical protein
MITTIVMEEAEHEEVHLAHTDHHQWVEGHHAIARDHRVEVSEEAEAVGEDVVGMDTGQDPSQGPGAGRRAEVPQDPTADLCRGHHPRGEEDMVGAILHRDEVDVVEEELVVVVVEAVEEARAIARMAVGVRATVAGAETVDDISRQRIAQHNMKIISGIVTSTY